MLYFGNWIGHHFFSLCNWGTNVEQCNCGTVKPSTQLRVKNGRGISRKIGLAIKYLLQCAQSSFNLHSYCQISLSMCSTVHNVYSCCRIFLAHLFVYTMRICTLAQLQSYLQSKRSAFHSSLDQLYEKQVHPIVFLKGILQRVFQPGDCLWKDGRGFLWVKNASNVFLNIISVDGDKSGEGCERNWDTIIQSHNLTSDIKHPIIFPRTSSRDKALFPQFSSDKYL